MQPCCKYLYLRMNFQRITKRLDHIGITASTICAIHCAIMPIAITFLPLLGLNFLSNEWVELTMLSISLIVGMVALGTAYFMVHQNIVPILYFLLGCVFVLIGHLSESNELEPILLPFGGVLFVVAHYLNYKSGKTKHIH